MIKMPRRVGGGGWGNTENQNLRPNAAVLDIRIIQVLARED